MVFWGRAVHRDRTPLASLSPEPSGRALPCGLAGKTDAKPVGRMNPPRLLLSAGALPTSLLAAAPAAVRPQHPTLHRRRCAGTSLRSEGRSGGPPPSMVWPVRGELLPCHYLLAQLHPGPRGTLERPAGSGARRDPGGAGRARRRPATRANRLGGARRRAGGRSARWPRAVVRVCRASIPWAGRGRRAARQDGFGSQRALGGFWGPVAAPYRCAARALQGRGLGQTSAPL